MLLNSSIRELKGIGDKNASLFAKIGVTTVGELIHYFPRSYEEFMPPVPMGSLVEEEVQAVAAFISSAPSTVRVKNLQITTTKVREGEDSLQLRWFSMPFLRNTLKRGFLYIFRGRVIRKGRLLSMEHPKIYSSSDYKELEGTLQPVYSLTAGITNHLISKMVRQALDQIPAGSDPYPEELRRRYHLAEQNYALSEIHFPINKEALMEARRRLVFTEFYEFLLQVRALKEKQQQLPNECPMKIFGEAEHLMAELPYELTGAQRRVWEEIKKDMTGQHLMSRLIQGDVGSGKTILAFLALLTAVENGYQGALMAPTEVLARQHLESYLELKEAYGLKSEAVLLVGSMTAKEKREVYEKTANGSADIIIGTHALIQEKVSYQRLGLVITDEQHRFGVRQRAALGEKGNNPHVLIMSATPIPRTLAIIVYGDLDISIIDEMPANRLPIKNCAVDESFRKKAYAFMAKEAAAGHQSYVICPMVEDNEELELENVIDYSEKLQKELPKLKVDYLHGRMKAAEKTEIMEKFGRGEIQVLVSTTVIEVGINVPNATVMMVENAERFGLSQLHQLRGRVGRGKWQSYCIFMSNSKSEDTKKRLDILVKSNDGFYVANEDLKLRGPGELFGLRQSGDLCFAVGDIYNDAGILKEASEAVEIYGDLGIQKPLKINL